MSGRFVRLGERDRGALTFSIDGRSVTNPRRRACRTDGRPASGLEGDTLLVAVLNESDRLRLSEFGDGTRAGFCLMGACQDCWLWSENGQRMRACTTPLEQGMRVLTELPGREWLTIAS